MNKFRLPLTLAALTLLGMSLNGCGGGRNLPDPQVDLSKAKSQRALLATGGNATAAPVAAAKNWSGFGTLKGQFLFAGNPPTPAKIDTQGKDPEVCGKTQLVDESLVVGPNKGLANLVLTVASKNYPVSPDAKLPKVVLDNKDCRFAPHVIAAIAGQEMLIRNSDSVLHNSNLGFANPSIPGGQEVPVTPPEAANVPLKVTCGVHGWMAGWIAVRKDAYVAITDNEGRFELANLPAGDDLEIQVWHERATGGLPLDQTELKDYKATSKGRFTVKLAADKPLEIKATIPESALK